MHYLPVLICGSTLAASWWLARTPLLVPLVYLCFSLLAMLFYWRDKSAARRGDWRTPETTLHLLGLLGGWPGAILAQQWFRHKTSKTSFRLVFWCTVLANSALLVWLHTSHGARYLNELLFRAEALLLASPLSGSAREGLLQVLAYRS